MLRKERAKLSDPLSDISIMEDPEALAEVVGAGRMLETIVENRECCAPDSLWKNNELSGKLVVGIEYYINHGPVANVPAAIQTEQDTASITEIFDIMQGKTTQPQFLLMVEGQLVRVMLKCVFHCHRVAFLRMWTCVAFLLSGYRFTGVFLDHLEDIFEQGIEPFQQLKHPSSLEGGVFIDPSSSDADKLWSRVLADVLRYRETCLRGLCHDVKSSVMIGADWEASAEQELMGRKSRSPEVWEVMFSEGAAAPVRRAKTKSSRAPLREMSGNARRDSKVEGWLGTPVSPRFSRGGGHASFGAPLRDEINSPIVGAGGIYDARMRTYI
jgi:hypothetical protein